MSRLPSPELPPGALYGLRRRGITLRGIYTRRERLLVNHGTR